MNITNFKQIRINDSENFVDVKPFNGHSNYGIMLTAYDFTSRVEIRRKGNETTMFVSNFEELDIPDDWKDAEIIFSNRPYAQNGS